MQITPAYCEAIATFYDMFDTEPLGRHRVFVCTNISCSLRGADAIHAAMKEAAEGLEDVQVRPFECLGACDIAPMASVDGEYVGPLTEDDTREIASALADGRPVLPEKNLRVRASVDPNVAGTDTVLPPGGETEDRLGASAPIEQRPDDDPLTP